MLGLARKTDNASKVRNEVAAFLYNAISAENSALSGLDRWTQTRVTDETMAKVALVLEADDPVEYCYQNLVREIDAEAKTRAFRISPAQKDDELNPVWTSGEARYQQAKTDTAVSEIIMQHLAEDANSVGDMSMALRSLLNSYHDEQARRRNGLPLELNERSTRELAWMIADLTERGGNFEQRISEIRERAGTA
jgi:hypothetical protein